MNDIDEMTLTETGEVDNTPDISSIPEPKAAEEVSTELEEATPISEEQPKAEPTETDEDIKKRNANQRIRELNAKARTAEERANTLAQRLKELTGSDEPTEYNTPFSPQVEPGTEISPDQYKQDVMRTADSLVNLRLKQQAAINQINSDSIEALRNYPELDPDSDSFNKELSDSVTEAVEAHVKASPYKSNVKQFVDRMMKPYKAAVSREVGQTTEKLAKQVSEAALRPTSIKQTEKRLDDKTVAELESELGIVQG